MKMRDKNVTSAMLVNRLKDKLATMTANFLLSRSSLTSNSQNERWAKLDLEAGYIQGDPTALQYRQMYNQEGIATRIVSVLSDECWAVEPLNYETEDNRKTTYERELEQFVADHDLWYWCQQLDEISGIGHFGIMVIGVDDGREMHEPIEGISDEEDLLPGYVWKQRKINYLMPYDESSVTIDEYNTDPSSKRYMQPTRYRIRQWNPDTASESITNIPTEAQELVVHWHRVHHQADNCKGHKFLGNPRLRNLHKRVFDIRKILASDGEIWYKGAWPGIAFETYPELTENADFDSESVKTEIEAYAQGLQRYVRLIGMSAKSMAPAIADPQPHLYEHYQYIAATLKCPLPVLLGHQTGHLAGEQDSVNWNRTLNGRQVRYLNSRMIHPLLRRFQLIGALPRTKTLITTWRDLNALSDKDKADVSLKRAQAILQYVTSGSSELIRPKHFFVLVLGFTPQEADAIIKECGGEDAMVSGLKKLFTATAGNTPSSTGTSPDKSTGSSGKRNGLGKSRRR